MQPYLPKYGPFDSASEMNVLRLTELKQQLHCPYMKLNLRRHPEASLKNQISVRRSSRHQGKPKEQAMLTSTPASSKIAPMVDSEVASSRELILSRIQLIAWLW